MQSYASPVTASPFGKFSLLRRFSLLICGMALCGLLATAAYLRPDRSGLGTHQQLGLQPCTIRTVFDLRCPSCGMTTAWAHFVRAEWALAASSSVSGTLLAAVACLAVPWTWAAAWRGRWMAVWPSEFLVLAFCITVMTVALSEWLVRLAIERDSRSKVHRDSINNQQLSLPDPESIQVLESGVHQEGWNASRYVVACGHCPGKPLRLRRHAGSIGILDWRESYPRRI